ncbi:RING finger protein 212B-like isoform X1 [Acanthaster planci]|uniref:RING finger protein 212B-like isoform X1 n=1 Tax=Acanthaster planci TaxID=133434 RepID=A0A8B7ZYK4_ACAPL|nr:RING finger protein 212B-like isoform X1 [Acanthaster planci]XP_022110495.1 RING finger protein 212B-like isoform X1 [Acanthaster planci]
MMADWVHCNQCFLQPGGGKKFFLTNCAHIFCDGCIQEGSKNQCHTCGSHCTTIELSSKMKPDVEIFFQSPHEIARKQHKQLMQVMDFQRNHSQRLAAYKRDQEAKMQSRMQMTVRQLDQARDLEREVLRLQEENCKLRRLVSGSPGPGGAAKVYRSSTPGQVLANSSIPPKVRNMVHQNSSQSISRSSSPYGRSQHIQQMETSKTPQSQPMTPTRTPPGPARLSIRTPPVNGRIGESTSLGPEQTRTHPIWTRFQQPQRLTTYQGLISQNLSFIFSTVHLFSGTVGTPTQGNMTLTPSGTLIRSANTPGAVVGMATPGRSSPMNVSPASNSFSSFSNFRSSQLHNDCSQGSTRFSLSQSSQSDQARRPIQLNYTPKTPTRSAAPVSQYRQGKS